MSREDVSATGTRHTRTRLPDGDGDPGRHPRRPPRVGKGLITVVAVTVLLIAAIAFANRANPPAANPAKNTDRTPTGSATAASGVPPVNTPPGELPRGFARTRQGAESAATNYAVALGSTAMFTADSRHRLVDALYTPDAAAALKAPQDKAYSPELLAGLGLDPQGNPPTGTTFVARTVPIGSRTEAYTQDRAAIAVWCMELTGMSGEKATTPIRTGWVTRTVQLAWIDEDWKITSVDQSTGPAPLPGDTTASASDEINKATQEFGGFTYAR
ncbi:hypothetical protein ACN20G_11065 [Streptomyces sp. BI20]|uniref:hypothetical protein n=1 Tax=Streptomyces sp. BI20 TaxID=3403460 RepID=UPI003C741447